MYEMEYTYNDEIIREFMASLSFSNIYFYSSVENFIGYMEIKVGNEILQYDFELEDSLDFINKIIDRETKEEFSLDVIFDKMYKILPISENDEELYLQLKNYDFNQYFVFAMEFAISKGMANKLRKEAQIEFLEYKRTKNYFNIYANIFIYGKKLKAHYVQADEYCTLYVDGINTDDLDGWFVREIKSSEHNKEHEPFYVDEPKPEYYGTVSLLGRTIAEEFKETKYYKMATLYDDGLKTLFRK